MEKGTAYSKSKRGTFALTSKKANAPIEILTVSKLLKLKQLALRQKVWFKSINRLERGIIDLTVQCVECVRSGRLAKVVTAIVSKLESAMEGMVDRLARSVGLGLAQKVSDIAVGWGNHLACRWANDIGLARYLAVVHLNKHHYFSET